MANNIKVVIDEKRATAFNFQLANDLYLFFEFRSPNSSCEIGIAYDEFVDGGEWYVNDGHLGYADHETVDDIIWNQLPKMEKFERFDRAVQAAMRKFNGTM